MAVIRTVVSLAGAVVWLSVSGPVPAVAGGDPCSVDAAVCSGRIGGGSVPAPRPEVGDGVDLPVPGPLDGAGVCVGQSGTKVRMTSGRAAVRPDEERDGVHTGTVAWRIRILPPYVGLTVEDWPSFLSLVMPSIGPAPCP